MTKLIGRNPHQTPRNADLGTLAYQDANDVNIQNLKIGDSALGTTPSAWLTILKDNNNSGNQFVVGDNEGQSPAIRTYTLPGTSGDPAGLILNHYYAQSGSGNQYMRYADFVANVGSGAGTTMRFITKNSSNAYSTGLAVDADGNIGVGTAGPSFTAPSGSTDQIGIEVQNQSNDSSAHLKLTGRNNTGNPGVATSFEIMHRGDSLKTSMYHAGTEAISIDSASDVTIHGNGNGLYFNPGSNQRIFFNTHRALEGSSDGATLQVGEGYTKVVTQGYNVTKATSSNRYEFEVSTSFTATGNSVTKHEINLNTLIGASTTGTLGYTVHVVGYASGGANAINYTYTVGGYSGHNYSAQNHSSMGAGTIENGYKSSNSTEYDARGISYHPCKNLGAYIANGEVYAYVPGPQRYGVTISNNSASVGCVMTIRGTYTG